jgi:hypothetical protein
MTDGAETPPEPSTAPTAPLENDSPTATDHGTRIAALEKGLAELAGIGREAFDGLVARIQKLEDAAVTVTKPVLPTGIPTAAPNRGSDKVPAKNEPRA